MATHRPTLPPNRGARDWDAAIADAKRHRGEWVLIFEQAPRSTPNAAIRGAVNVLKDPAWNFELATRNTIGQRADIWMRASRVTPDNPKILPRPSPSERRVPPAIAAQEPDQSTQEPDEFIDVPPPNYPVEAEMEH